MSDVRLDHVAVALPRMADALPFVAGELGGRPTFGFSSGLFRFGQWRFAGGGRLEILEPRGDDGFLHRFLAAHGPGVHHVTLRVPSLAETCERARDRGYTIVGLNDANPHWAEAFLHPREALGIVVQLAQTDDVETGEVDGPAGGRRFRELPHPAATPPPVTLIGLRLSARSAERARQQWAEILHGACEEAAGALVFTWKDSPLRLAVEIDADRAEGPLAIEVASDRALTLPAGPHPVLGAVFARGPAAGVPLP